MLSCNNFYYRVFNLEDRTEEAGPLLWPLPVLPYGVAYSPRLNAQEKTYNTGEALWERKTYKVCNLLDLLLNHRNILKKLYFIYR